MNVKTSHFKNTNREGAHNAYKKSVGMRSPASSQLTMEQFKEWQVNKNMEALERKRIRKINEEYKNGLREMGIIVFDSEGLQ